ncbi:hypothetical protein PLICRDRAFT_41852 [Plicaturopsis crispa FD-325 SS-3]|nr:hypothetical protein PLICRDRAFT_41852 [Plicaturopsis crispa FD-325 SS-3]
MGAAVSAITSAASSKSPPDDETPPSPSPRPTYIPIAPHVWNPDPTPSPSSPALTFYTAPSTPIAESPVRETPLKLPTSALRISATLGDDDEVAPPPPVVTVTDPEEPAHRRPSPPLSIPLPPPITHSASLPSPSFEYETEPYPNSPPPPSPTPSLSLDDASLSPLEKIYLFSRSRAPFHRVFIARALPTFLREVDPREAVEYVLPLLSGLAMDEEEGVKEALAGGLVDIVWWFFTHCQLTEDDQLNLPSSSPPSPAVPESPAPDYFESAALSTPDPSIPTPISVQAFTPILGTLLLSPNALVGGPARHAVVQLLGRMRRADLREENEVLVEDDDAAEDDDDEPRTRLFGKTERRLFEREILQQVVIGMGRLDGYWEDEEGLEEESRGREDRQDVLEGREDERAGREDVLEGREDVLEATEDRAEREEDREMREEDRGEREADQGMDVASTRETDRNTRKVDRDAREFDRDTRQTDRDMRQVDRDARELERDTRQTDRDTRQTDRDEREETREQDAQDREQYAGEQEMQLQMHMPGAGERDLGTGTEEEYPSVAYIATMRSPTGPVPPTSLAPAAASPARRPSPGALSHDTVRTLETGRIAQSTAAEAALYSGGPRLTTTEVNPYFPVMASSAAFNPPRPAVEDTGVSDDEGPQYSGSSLVDPDAFVGEGREGEEGAEMEDEDMEDASEQEQAAVGRLSSMSLMAAVAASGSLGEETKNAFVKEVERVGRDQIYWVRREASFALGALAKVVPEEVVICSLLPLFESLCTDPVWHVRHSALFALPAILSRLPRARRRALALDTLVPLATDDSAQVRSGVLEALGEVMYTFHREEAEADQHEEAEQHPEEVKRHPEKDDADVPEELVQLFVGRKEDRRIRDEQQGELHPDPASSAFGEALGIPQQEHPNVSALESFYTDPARPLVCAFNMPAVALTLGRDRWCDLRELYLELAADRTPKVRRTLAASLGELGKIVGPESARRDLVGVWWDAVRCEEDGEVRLKAVESVLPFVEALGDRKGPGEQILEGLGEVWEEGLLKGWRERETVVGLLKGLVSLLGNEKPEVIRGLLMRGLVDHVAAVREAAVSALPLIWKAFSARHDILEELNTDLRGLAVSSSFRHRMTFVACQQALLFSDDTREAVQMPSDDHRCWKALAALADDDILGVRIGLARLVGAVHGQTIRDGQSPPEPLVNLARHLSQDPSEGVRAYVSKSIPPPRPRFLKRLASKHGGTTFSTFSRPPPPQPGNSSGGVDSSDRGGNEEAAVHESQSSEDIQMGDTGFSAHFRNAGPATSSQSASTGVHCECPPQAGNAEAVCDSPHVSDEFRRGVLEPG